MPEPLNLTVRPRRLRLRTELRDMLRRITIRRRDIIVPVFVTEGAGVRKEVASMPGVFQMSVDVATDCAVVQQLGDGVGQATVADIVDADDLVFCANGHAALYDFLTAAFHLVVVALKCA